MPVLGVLGKIFLIAHTVSDVVHRRVGLQPADHREIALQLIQPIQHPVLVLVGPPEGQKGNLTVLKHIPAQIALGAVRNLQEILPFPAALGHMDIGDEILGS